MSPGLYLVYFPTGYYPLVQVEWVYPNGADLVLIGARVVANSNIGAEWARLADEGPTLAVLQAASKRPIRLPRQCVVHELNVKKWAEHLPEAVAYSKKQK